MNDHPTVGSETGTAVVAGSINDPVLLPPAAAAYMGYAPATLKTMRMMGRGPAFLRLSSRRVGYRLSDIIEFLETCERQSTLEDKGRAA